MTTLNTRGELVAEHPVDIALSSNEQLNSLSPEAVNAVNLISLDFPKLGDGRALSWAYLLRHRFGFKGDLRATGEVLADHLHMYARSGFSSFTLRADQSLDVARAQLVPFSQPYQGAAGAVGAVSGTARFAREQTITAAA